VAGCDLHEVAEREGTPAYVIDVADLRARCRAYRDDLARRHRDAFVSFASKAFPCTAVYRLVASEGLGCDVASEGELRLALHPGVRPADLCLHGNAKGLGALELVVIDSWDDRPPAAGPAAVRAGRARPRHARRGARYPSGGLHGAVIAHLRRSSRLRLLGLHTHVGSQILALFSVYNLGGGLGAEYRAEDRVPPRDDDLDALVAAVHEHLGADRRLLLEPAGPSSRTRG
jgi:diaminopimelate decarboxylase